MIPRRNDTERECLLRQRVLDFQVWSFDEQVHERRQGRDSEA